MQNSKWIFFKNVSTHTEDCNGKYNNLCIYNQIISHIHRNSILRENTHTPQHQHHKIIPSPANRYIWLNKKKIVYIFIFYPPSRIP